MEFTVARGDIAAQSADALVNAAGTSLRMGSGVAAALLESANGPLEAAAQEQGPIRLGDVVVTDAYELDAKYVVHAAVVPHGSVRERTTRQTVERATASALAAADERGCRTIVFPLLGCGNGGLYVRDGVEAVCSTIQRYTPSTLETARVLAYTDHEFTALTEAAETAGKQ